MKISQTSFNLQSGVDMEEMATCKFTIQKAKTPKIGKQ